MKKLLTVFAGVLLTMPLAALDASALTSVEPAIDAGPAPSVTGTCWYWIAGRWVPIPC